MEFLSTKNRVTSPNAERLDMSRNSADYIPAILVQQRPWRARENEFCLRNARVEFPMGKKFAG
jgi:hypothetical protein